MTVLLYKDDGSVQNSTLNPEAREKKNSKHPEGGILAAARTLLGDN